MGQRSRLAAINKKIGLFLPVYIKNECLLQKINANIHQNTALLVCKDKFICKIQFTKPHQTSRKHPYSIKAMFFDPVDFLIIAV